MSSLENINLRDFVQEQLIIKFVMSIYTINLFIL